MLDRRPNAKGLQLFHEAADNLNMDGLARFLPRLRDESGVSLVELLTAVSLGVVVMLAVAAFSDGAQQSWRVTRDRTESLRQHSLGVERIARELRQAARLDLNPDRQRIQARTYVRESPEAPKQLRLVRFDCSTNARCTRQKADSAGTFEAATTILEGVDTSNTEVFVPLPDAVNPNYVQIKVLVRPNGATRSVPIEDGVGLRNNAFR